MTIPWGPALDAEMTYRHERVRSDLQRRRTSHREPARHVPAEGTVTPPMIPIQPHPLNRAPAQLKERAEAGPGRDRAGVHAA